MTDDERVWLVRDGIFAFTVGRPRASIELDRTIRYVLADARCEALERVRDAPEFIAKDLAEAEAERERYAPRQGKGMIHV